MEPNAAVFKILMERFASREEAEAWWEANSDRYNERMVLTAEPDQ